MRVCANTLYKLDEAYRQFRLSHGRLAEHHLGRRAGSAQKSGAPGVEDTSGVAYLLAIARMARFYPELWTLKKQQIESSRERSAWSHD